jgi:hypothetical protein
MSVYNLLLGGGGASPFRISYVGALGYNTSAGNTTTDTYNSVNIGTPDPTRILIAVGTGDNNGGSTGGMTSLTCNTIAMTAVVNLTSSRSPSCIYILSVPTGTTANFVLNHSSSVWGMNLYVMYNSINSGTATASASAYTASTPPTMTISCPANGAALYAINNCGNPVGTTVGVNNGYNLYSGFTGQTCLYTPTPAGSVTNTVAASSGLSSYACASFA